MEKCPCQIYEKSCCACVSMHCDECHGHSKFDQGRFCSNCGRPLKAELTRLYIPNSEVEKIFDEIEKKLSSMKYSTNTSRKTVKIEELKEQVDWVLHEVVPNVIAELKKKYMEGGLTKSKMCDKMTIGECIRKCREEKKLTQDALAKKAGISPPAISHWENSRAYPTILLLICIADVLDVSLDQLVGRDFHKN